MKIQRVKIADHQYIWLVLDNNYLPIEPIDVKQRDELTIFFLKIMV